MSAAACVSSHPTRSPYRLGLSLLLSLALCVVVGAVVREVVLARQLDLLRIQTNHHTEFYRLSLESLLSRNESLPRIIAVESRLKSLLLHPHTARAQREANDYLLDVKNGADLNATYLLDNNGLTLAASNFDQPGTYVGHNYAYRPYFRDAMAGKLGTFYGIGTTTGDPGYFLTAPIEEKGERIGTATVKVSLENFESALAKSGDTVLLVDSMGVIFLASVGEWKYRTLTPLSADALLQLRASRQYNDRPLQALDVSLALQDTARVIRMSLPNAPAQDFLAQSKRVGPLGWSIVLLTATRQERQNALLAGVAAGFAVAFALSMLTYLRLNAKRFSERRQAEAALRRAHHELEQRITERTAELQKTNVSLEDKIDVLKTTESILCETRDQAVQAGKLAVLGQMAAGISHEINQPLTALHTFTDNAVDLLDRGRLGEVRQNLEFIKQMAVRMGHLVGEVKTFSRKPPAQRQKVKIAEAIDQALMLVEPRRRQIGATIEVPQRPAEIQVWGDQQRLEQVLVNLLRNGLDAVAEAPDKSIKVAVSGDDRQVLMSVHDRGQGISDDVLTHLFEPFFTTKSAGQGLGLGLAISRMIVAELGGRLEVRNHPAGGAEFTVILEKA